MKISLLWYDMHRFYACYKMDDFTLPNKQGNSIPLTMSVIILIFVNVSRCIEYLVIFLTMFDEDMLECEE